MCEIYYVIPYDRVHRSMSWFVTKPIEKRTWRKEAAAAPRGATGTTTTGNGVAAYDGNILEAQLLKPNSLDRRSLCVRCSGAPRNEADMRNISRWCVCIENSIVMNFSETCCDFDDFSSL